MDQEARSGSFRSFAQVILPRCSEGAQRVPLLRGGSVHASAKDLLITITPGAKLYGITNPREAVRRIRLSVWSPIGLSVSGRQSSRWIARIARGAAHEQQYSRARLTWNATWFPGVVLVPGMSRTRHAKSGRLHYTLECLDQVLWDFMAGVESFC